MTTEGLTTGAFMIGMGLLFGVIGYFIELGGRARLYRWFALVSAIPIAMVGIFVLANVRATGQMPEAIGTVLSIAAARESGYRSLTVEFSVGEQRYTMTGSLRDSVAREYGESSAIPVYYMPLLPSWSVLSNPLDMDIAVFMIATGIAFLLLGGIPMLKQR